MSDTVIRVENLSKKYILSHQQQERYTALRDVMAQGVRNLGKKILAPLTSRHESLTSSREEFYALRDISFEIKQGDRVGIIGRNGAGKSTLLKILSRITEPTDGRIEIKGRVASLLEVGTGFHPELTGRENIFLNGAILGMGRAEIKRKFDEIVAFAEVEKFLDTPVKRYSSGMYVRLAFAVAAHLEPEILIVDEVLAVGDTQFQKKCLGKMEEAGKGGRTILFVSHNMGAILSLCTRCILFENGWKIADGVPAGVAEMYMQDYSVSSSFIRDLDDNGKPYIVSGNLVSKDSRKLIELYVVIHALKQMKVCIDVRLVDALGVPVGYGSLGALDDSKLVGLKPGKNTFTIEMPQHQLAQGKYFISIDLTEPDIQYFDRVEKCLSFEIIRSPEPGICRFMSQNWGYGSLHVPLKLLL